MAKNLFFDLEAGGLLGSNSSILSIAYGDKSNVQDMYASPTEGSRVYYWSEKNVWEPIASKFGHRIENERDILSKFIKQLEQADIISGWNIGYSAQPVKYKEDLRGFDLSMLATRARKYEGLSEKLRLALKGKQIRDVGQEYAVITARTILQNQGSVDESIYEQAIGFEKKVAEHGVSLSDTQAAARIASTNQIRFAGWKQELMFETMFDEKMKGAHEAVEDVRGGLRLADLSEADIEKRLTQRIGFWNRQTYYNKLISSAKAGVGSEKQFETVEELIKGSKKYGLEGDFRAGIKKLAADYGASEADILAGKGIGVEGWDIFKSGRFAPSSEKIFQNLPSKMFATLKSNKGVAALLGGVGAMALLKPGRLFQEEKPSLLTPEQQQQVIDDLQFEGDRHTPKEEFSFFKKALQKYGEAAGTFHDRVLIPKQVISKKELTQDLEFIPVQIAVPETGEETFTSYRHEKNLYHIHDHGDMWSMHKDRHAASTMLMRSSENILEKMGHFIAGAPHVVTEGIPGMASYIWGKLTGTTSMKERLVRDTSMKYWQELNSFSGKDDQYNTIEGLRHDGMAAKMRQALTDFGSGYQGPVSLIHVTRADRKQIKQEGLKVDKYEQGMAGAGIYFTTKDWFLSSDVNIKQGLGIPAGSAFGIKVDPRKVQAGFSAGGFLGLFPKYRQEPLSEFLKREDKPDPFEVVLSRDVKPNELTYLGEYEEGEGNWGDVLRLGASGTMLYAGLTAKDVPFKKRMEDMVGKKATPFVTRIPAAMWMMDEAMTIARDPSLENVGKFGLGWAGWEAGMKGGTALAEKFIKGRHKGLPGVVGHITAPILAGLTTRIIPGRDDDYNTIEGLSEKGISSELRKAITDFGSGYQGIISEYQKRFGNISITELTDIPSIYQPSIHTININPLQVAEQAQEYGLDSSTFKNVALAHELGHARKTPARKMFSLFNKSIVKAGLLGGSILGIGASSITEDSEYGYVAPSLLAAQSIAGYTEEFAANRQAVSLLETGAGYSKEKAGQLVSNLNKTLLQPRVAFGQYMGTGLALAGILAGINFGISLFSGKDDEYNTIEGLQENGIAGQLRKINTDFGSGTILSKAVNRAKSLFGKPKGFSVKEIGDLAKDARRMTSAQFARKLDVETLDHPQVFGGGGGLNIAPKESNKWAQKHFGMRPKDISEQIKSMGLEQGKAYVSPDPVTDLIGVLQEQTSIGMHALRQQQDIARQRGVSLKELLAQSPEATKAVQNIRAGHRSRTILQRLGSEEREDVAKTVMFHEAAELKNITAVSVGNLPFGPTPNQVQHILTLPQEELFLRGLGSQNTRRAFGHLRQFVDNFSGFDDAYNTIEGLRHGNLASELRKILTDFGSGWDALRGLVRAGETFADMTKSKAFRQAVKNATEVKVLDDTGMFGTTYLMRSGSFRGQEGFLFVRKMGEIGPNEIAAMKAMEGSAGPSLYGASLRRGKGITGETGMFGTVDMELFTGQALRDLSPEQLSAIQEGIPSVFRQLHNKGFTHRDSHLGNIMAVETPTGTQLGLIDYGNAARMTKSYDPTEDIITAQKQAQAKIEGTSQIEAVDPFAQQAVDPFAQQQVSLADVMRSLPKQSTFTNRLKQKQAILHNNGTRLAGSMARNGGQRNKARGSIASKGSMFNK